MKGLQTCRFSVGRGEEVLRVVAVVLLVVALAACAGERQRLADLLCGEAAVAKPSELSSSSLPPVLDLAAP